MGQGRAVVFSNRAKWGAAVALLLLGGCAASAPKLPPDTTSVNRNEQPTIADFAEVDRGDEAATPWPMSVDRSLTELLPQMAESRLIASRIKLPAISERCSCALIATEGNYAEKDEIARLYQRRDTLIQLAAVKSCAVGN